MAQRLVIGQRDVVTAALLVGHQPPRDEVALRRDARRAVPRRAAVTEDALLGDHQRGAERDLVGAEREHDRDVETRLQAPVAAQPHLLRAGR
jgi:hypothetical protein